MNATKVFGSTLPYLSTAVKLFVSLEWMIREEGPFTSTQVTISSFPPTSPQEIPKISRPNADAFRPERWQNPLKAHRDGRFTAFGAGGRMCLGKQLALDTVFSTLVVLIKTFPGLRLPDDEDETIGNERQHLALVLSCAEGCRVTV